MITSHFTKSFKEAAVADFSKVTELAGEPISRIQLQRLVQRYVWAAKQCPECDVLDVACGSGAGMGLFATVARQVVGIDVDERILQHAIRHYGHRFAFYKCDAQNLPFAGRSFDIITIFEAIYYLPDPDVFFAECRRLLRLGGKILISTANKNLYDFDRSSFSTVYLNAPEMSARLAKAGFSTQFFGGDTVLRTNVLADAVRLLRFTAAWLRIIPKSMRGKRILRRLIFGALRPMPAEVTGSEMRYEAPVPIRSDLPNFTHRILYCTATVLNN